MLKVKNLDTGYGKKQVIHDVSLEVENNEIVALIGPNGSGKSTILKSIIGVLPVWKGEIFYKDERIDNQKTSKIIQQALTFCPQGNRVFADMTVRENLEVGGFHLKKPLLKERIDYVLALFPILKDRIKQIAGTLSGGEQQMLSLARALIPQPRLLLLDEPSLGLAPKIQALVFEKITEINETQKIAMLIVEQKVLKVLDISQRVYSIKLGKIAFKGESKNLKSNPSHMKDLFL